MSSTTTRSRIRRAATLSLTTLLAAASVGVAGTGTAAAQNEAEGHFTDSTMACSKTGSYLYNCTVNANNGSGFAPSAVWTMTPGQHTTVVGNLASNLPGSACDSALAVVGGVVQATVAADAVNCTQSNVSVDLSVAPGADICLALDISGNFPPQVLCEHSVKSLADLQSVQRDMVRGPGTREMRNRLNFISKLNVMMPDYFNGFHAYYANQLVGKGLLSVEERDILGAAVARLAAPRGGRGL